MKILIFSITYFPLVGGAEIAVKEITDRIGRPKIMGNEGDGRPPLIPTNSSGEGFEFDLITARLDKKLPIFERIGNANVYRVGKGWILDKYFYPLLAYKRAKELHKTRNYKIVQAIMATWAGIAALFFKLKYKKIKYLLTEQSGDSEFFIWIRTFFWHPLYKMIYTKADYVQVISHWLEKRVRRYGYKGAIKIVPNGVDIDKFKAQSAKLKVRDELGFNKDDVIIITVSRLVKKNGLEDLIRAIKILEKFEIKKSEGESWRIKMLIVGTGKLEKYLKRLVEKLDLRNMVLFLGNINHNELPAYLWASDIFCRPSLSEGFGNVFVEAMAASLPVIATPVGGIVDFLKDGETGLFCKIENPESIASSITRLLNDKDLYNKIVEDGLKMVREKYDWNIIAGEMRRIYEKI